MKVARGHDRLGDLGFASYREYLRSSAWRQARERYIASGRPTSCAVCGDERAELHHRSYHRVGGRERPSDLVALCRLHHRAVHHLRRAEPWRTTTSAIRELRRRLAAIGTGDGA